jgi:hypothetical protein
MHAATERDLLRIPGTFLHALSDRVLSAPEPLDEEMCAALYTQRSEDSLARVTKTNLWSATTFDFNAAQLALARGVYEAFVNDTKECLQSLIRRGGASAVANRLAWAKRAKSQIERASPEVRPFRAAHHYVRAKGRTIDPE